MKCEGSYKSDEMTKTSGSNELYFICSWRAYDQLCQRLSDNWSGGGYDSTSRAMLT